MSLLTSCYRQLTALDLDEIFSYQTTKEVRMLDRRLGMVNWLIRAVVLVYVIGYVFILREGYTEMEKSVGHCISTVNGTTYSTTGGKPRPWDAIDAVTPALENGAAFVATTVFVTERQVLTNSSNLARPCSKATEKADCPNKPPLSYGTCQNNYCQEYGWAPFFSETDGSNTHKFELETADEFGVWLRSSIAFPSLDETRIFSTIDTQRPTPYRGGQGVPVLAKTDSSTTLGGGGVMPPDYFTIGELLALAGTSFDTIKSTGCTLAVSYRWKCFVDASAACAPELQVARLDLNEKRKGFMYQYAHYYRTMDKPPHDAKRDLYSAKGVRLLLSSRGEGRRVSVSAIMLQISSGIALLWLAGFVADFLMLHVLPERKHYRTYKQERTPDFSDLRNKIAEVEGEKKKLRDRKNRFAAKLDES